MDFSDNDKMAKPSPLNRPADCSEWRLRQANARFGEVFRLALDAGPQRVRQGKETVVVISADEYDRFSARRTRAGGLVRFFAESPLAKFHVNFERKRPANS